MIDRPQTSLARILAPALTAILVGVVLVPASARPSPVSAQPVAQVEQPDPAPTPDSGPIDDGFIVDEQAVLVSLGAGAALDGTGQLDASRHAPSSTIEFANRPQIISIDTNDQLGAYLVRSRSNGQWSPWIELETPVDEAPDGLPGEEGSSDHVPIIGPVWVGDGTDAVELIQVEGLASSVVVTGLETTEAQREADRAVVDSGGAGDADVTAGLDLALAAKPTIRPRSDWGARAWAGSNSGCPSQPTQSLNIDAMIVHHTVTSNNYQPADTPAILRSIQRYHIDSNGWCDIAYNFIVDQFGTIWEARSGSIDGPVQSGATLGFNTGTLSVAMLGQYQTGASPAATNPPAVAIDAVVRVGAWKLGQHGVDPRGTVTLKSRTSSSNVKIPGGTWVTVPTIVGHHDLSTSSCPGSLLYAQLDPIRSAIDRLSDSSVPVALPQRRPTGNGPAAFTVGSDGAIRPAGSASVASGAPSSPASPVIAVAAVRNAGFLLTSDGTVIGFGGSPSPSAKPAGSAAVVDIVASADGSGGWVVEQGGTLQGFNGQSDRSPSGFTGTAAAAVMLSDGNGYVVNTSGRLFAFGTASAVSSQPSGASGVVDIGLYRAGQASGWVLQSSGRLVPFGGAPAWQSALNGTSGNRGRAIVADPAGFGGWVLDSEGRLYPFGSPRPIQPITTTVGTAMTVDAAGWFVLDPALANTGDGKFIAALTRLFLLRSASVAEIEHGMWDLDYRGRVPLVADFVRSPEWAGAIVDDIYLDVLGRKAEPAGRNYWINRLNNGLSTQVMGAEFYASPEYVTASGSSRAYVTKLYRVLLNRAPDQPGLNYWVGELDSGRKHPIHITLGFYQSIESRRGRVTDLYKRILGRSPETEGLNFWADRLLREDDIALALNLASSVEYYVRVSR